VIYSLGIPLALMDIWVTVYQHVCFRAYGIPRVKRSDYVIIDRNHLRYLNLIEALNCVYCGYANGVISYAREIASRTEQHWRPIKHALRTRATRSFWITATPRAIAPNSRRTGSTNRRGAASLLLDARAPREVFRPKVDRDRRQKQRGADPEQRRMMRAPPVESHRPPRRLCVIVSLVHRLVPSPS
jgi:hypothetical protein